MVRFGSPLSAPNHSNRYSSCLRLPFAICADLVPFAKVLFWMVTVFVQAQNTFFCARETSPAI